MTAFTENDLKRLEDLIINGQKAIETRLTSLENGQKAIETRLTSLESGQKAIENSVGEIKREIQVLEIGQTEIKGEIRTLDAKITGLNARVQLIEASVGKIPDLAEKIGEVKNWKQIGISIVTAFVGGVIGWLIRGK